MPVGRALLPCVAATSRLEAGRTGQTLLEAGVGAGIEIVAVSWVTVKLVVVDVAT